ncbi:hypothetical protein ACFUAH_26405 [Streptomyces albidoflavus]|uniref:hypothetical protein n=1 Tax=Streptomyces TaxID=1883 RepID=UPI000743B2F8|nr:hypothetical protein [Streptomyces albidoflavus]KUL59606.1 hypothetical protein ADL32_19365 [Streptomyces albidoflavus]RZE20974.1 hypothetical protein C0Q93_16345 [Streptomyces albidoflavus]RZE41525.1 hypothetical protein C0Q94_16365 [Streptomyces albidoflavus]
MVSDSLYRVENQQFSALFMLGAEDSKETVENVDAEISLPDGTRWSATFMTLRAIEQVMSRWKETGECASGAYFQCSDLVIIPEGGLAAMLDSFKGIIDSGGPEGVLQLLNDD